MSLATVEFGTRFAPCESGCKLWFLIGGTLIAPGIEKVEIDGIPTLAKKVRNRWKNMLMEKEHSLIGYGDILVQQLGELKVKEVWPQFYFPWQHARAKRLARKNPHTPVNLYKTGSIRAFAKRSIV
jgi:hypothetical protein